MSKNQPRAQFSAQNQPLNFAKNNKIYLVLAKVSKNGGNPEAPSTVNIGKRYKNTNKLSSFSHNNSR
jgi:hypothetical protein